MPNPLKFIPMILDQQMGPQELARKEEPKAITDDPDNVIQYDQVMTTKLVIAYAIGLEAIHRARTQMPGKGAKALDLACGPGHYTLCLQTYLNYDKVTGLDLSPNMIAIAQGNARQKKLENHTSFQLADITHLKQVDDNSFDLSSCTDAAHHMEGRDKTDAAVRQKEALEEVGKILVEMDRVTKPDGLVMLMDLARLRTSRLTEKYVNLLGGDYGARGLQAFFEDFRNSMYAAWTYGELETAIPKNSRRVWCHLVSKALPTLQIVFGLPVGRKELFLRKGLPWEPQDCPVPKNLRTEWKLGRFTLFSAAAKFIPAASQSA